MVMCLFGLVIHVGVITSEYLKYEATSNVEMETTDRLPIPALSLCFRYVDILDIARLNRDSSMTLSPPNYTNRWSRQDSIAIVQKSITLRQLFDYTPSSSQLFTDSFIRHPGQYEVKFLDEFETRSVFDVSKYFTQDYICYRIQVVSTKTVAYDYDRVLKSMNYPGAAYEIGLNFSAISKATAILPVVHAADDLPYYSRFFATKISRFNQQMETPLFYLTSEKISIRKLKAPYPTDCDGQVSGIDDLPERITGCLINQTLESFGKLPFTNIIMESRQHLDHPILNSVDLLADKNMSTGLTTVEDFCQRLLPKPECYVFMFYTSIVDKSTGKDTMSFRVNLPNRPEVKISFQPMTQFFDYVTYVLSCLGTWIGISIFDLNPIPILIRRKIVLNRRSNSRFDGQPSADNRSTQNNLNRVGDWQYSSEMTRMRNDIVELRKQMKLLRRV